MPSFAHVSAADWVIEQFGGVRATARAIGRDPGSVSRWRMPRDKKGTDGGVPRLAQIRVLEAARRMGLDITEADLVSGRRVRTS